MTGLGFIGLIVIFLLLDMILFKGGVTKFIFGLGALILFVTLVVGIISKI